MPLYSPSAYCHRSTTLHRLDSPRISEYRSRKVSLTCFKRRFLTGFLRYSHTVAFAALSKRSLIASTNWPPNITLRAPEFTKAFIAKDPKLEALLSTEDWSVDGIYSSKPPRTWPYKSLYPYAEQNTNLYSTQCLVAELTFGTLAIEKERVLPIELEKINTKSPWQPLVSPSGGLAF